MILENSDTKAGYVAIVGAPNAGKSTLMNEILGTKISIVSRKAQTTRARMVGIYTEDKTQIVFIDTPGLFQPKKRLEKAMVSSIWSGIEDANVVLVLFDASKNRIDGTTKHLIKDLKETQSGSSKKIVLALNKVDQIKKDTLLKLATEFASHDLFDDIFMISALNRDGVDDLIKTLEAKMPSSPWFYEEDQVTAMPGKLYAAEVTREKIFNSIHDEIPYNLTVETDSYEDFEDGSLKINQTVYVKANNHKGIIIGHKGETLKKIGTEARLELKETLMKNVHLKIFVKVKPNWQNDIEHYENMGLEHF
ncbi:MAG: GTPase Era [Rickettsiales bacterium]|nr:GTPase Era [Rickettsiales bacterium]|tara:strand:- start:207 stop:1127 length:921 start_codon:yes stop_codon:yes gene_type:complete